MAGIKLGKLPDRTPVKLTFSASPELKMALDDYLDLYRTVHDDKTATAGDLIPAIIEAFLDSDRAFRIARRGSSE